MTGDVGKLFFAVVVVVGWVLALTWLIFGVSQIAVEHTVVRDCQVAEGSIPGGLECPR